MSVSLVLAFAVVSGIFAYLAINTPKEHAPLQILNYLLTYMTIFFTGYLGYAEVTSNESQEGLMVVWNNAFSWLFYIVVGYFMLYLLVQAFRLYKTKS